MLERVYADNYRCLVNFEWKPGRTQLVLGLNGAGKSTALDVLTLLRDYSIRGMPCPDRLGPGTTTRWQGVTTQRFELDWRGPDGLFRYVLAVQGLTSPADPGQSQVKVIQESVECEGGSLFRFEDGTVHLHNDRHEDKVQFPFDWRRSALAIVEPRKDNTKLTAFKRWLGSILHVQIDPWAMTGRSERESGEPSRNLSNFADWYRHLLLEKGGAVTKAIEDLRAIFPGLQSLNAREAGQNVRVLEATFSAPLGHASTSSPDTMSQYFDDLSEGQRTLVALYVILHCAVEANRTLMIDEPDNFVALAEIQPWLLRLLDLVEERGAQVILVSHHPEILNQMAANGGVVFDRPGGGPTRVLPFAPSGEQALTPAEIIARGWERE